MYHMSFRTYNQALDLHLLFVQTPRETLLARFRNHSARSLAPPYSPTSLSLAHSLMTTSGSSAKYRLKQSRSVLRRRLVRWLKWALLRTPFSIDTFTLQKRNWVNYHERNAFIYRHIETHISIGMYLATKRPWAQYLLWVSQIKTSK